jgi:hypothetical protein
MQVKAELDEYDGPVNSGAGEGDVDDVVELSSTPSSSCDTRDGISPRDQSQLQMFKHTTKVVSIIRIGGL